MAKLNVSPAVAVVAVAAVATIGAATAGKKAKTSHEQPYYTPSPASKSDDRHGRETQPKPHDTKGASQMGADLYSKRGTGEGAIQK